MSPVGRAARRKAETEIRAMLKAGLEPDLESAKVRQAVQNLAERLATLGEILTGAAYSQECTAASQFLQMVLDDDDAWAAFHKACVRRWAFDKQTILHGQEGTA